MQDTSDILTSLVQWVLKSCMEHSQRATCPSRSHRVQHHQSVCQCRQHTTSHNAPCIPYVQYITKIIKSLITHNMYYLYYYVYVYVYYMHCIIVFPLYYY